MRITHLKRMILVITLGISIAGCASITEESTAPDNKKIYGIDCSGKAVSISRCYEKAQKMCPNGYTVISNEAPSGSFDMPPMLELSMAVADSIPGVKKGITVKCR